MPKLSIDGCEVSVPNGTTVIQAAEKLGVYVPRYCYHPGLSIAGNCRICLVEVEKAPKLQIACNTPVTEGMVVHTKSDKAEDGRRAVLEFLLANHPLDCPVCDQSGECDLQNFYLNFGLYNPRFREHKVKKQKAVALGPHVMLDQERHMPDGFHFPWGGELPVPHLVYVLLGVASFSIKGLTFCFVFMQLRWTLPRLRYDQLMSLGWKGLFPISVVNVVVTAVVLVFFAEAR